MVAQRPVEVEFKTGELVYWRGEKIPPGWKHLTQYDNKIVAWDEVGEEDDLTEPRPTYKAVGIKVITKIQEKRK